MKNKLAFVSGMAVGYVLGTRAGRDSYEKLKEIVSSFRKGPTRRDKVSDTAGPPRNKTSEVQEQASQPEKKAKEEITGAPRHDTTPHHTTPHHTTPHQDEATSGTPKHDHTKPDAPPESDFYGIGGPASHSSLDADTAQPAHRDETDGQNRTD